MWFQKKKEGKETEKNPTKFYLVVMDVFTFDFATIRTLLNFVSLWCTYISHKIQDDFIFL